MLCKTSLRGTALLSLLAFAACTSWQPYDPRPDVPLPRVVQVRLASGDKVKLYDTRWDGDSAVVGHQASLGGPPLRAPLNAIEGFEESRFSWTTTLLISGSVVAFFAILGAAGAFDLEYSF